MKYLLYAVIIGLAIFAGLSYLNVRSLERDMAEAVMARDSALIASGQAERQVDDWRGRFGIAQRELEVKGELGDLLDRENKDLREALEARIVVHDTITVPADETTSSDSTLHFTNEAADDSTGFVFDAWVDVAQRNLRLEWQLALSLEVVVAEAKNGRPDIFLRVPGNDNVTITVDRFDYLPRTRSFWERVAVGPLGLAGSGGGTIGALVCVEPWCGFYSPIDQSIGVSYLWRPFK